RPNPQPALAPADREPISESAALRDERYRAGLQPRRARHTAECGVDILVDVHETEAVGSHDAQTGLRGARQHFVLQRRAARPAFAESPAQHHRVRYALRDAIGYDCIDP